jgi:Raf kinase inhibitor-like YbhB/YbcL family protein
MFRFATVVMILGGLITMGSDIQAALSSAGEASGGTRTSFTLRSPDFVEGGSIPSRFTCDGENISPALTWSGVPAGTQSLALVCEDPDASRGTWVHWIVTNIPVSTSRILTGGPVPKGAIEIKTDFGKPGYGGPCPPSGRHRYYFKLYALNVSKIKNISRADYERVLGPLSLGTVVLMGTYARKEKE